MEAPTTPDFTNILIAETKRRLFEENIPRIRKCLGWLTEEEIWLRPNAESNSVGNLVLHLCGNARQWICAGLGKQPDVRTRQAEFDEEGPLPTAQLLGALTDLETTVREVLDRVKPEDLTQKHLVQGYQEYGISILVHVVEHFSYHVGQITYFVKARKNLDTGYYAGEDLG